MSCKIISCPSVWALFQKGTPIHPSQRCLWRGIITRRKQTLGWDVVALCGVSISVGILTTGLVSGLNAECPKAPEKGGFKEKQNKKKNKNQRWRESVTSIPACVTTPKMEFLRLEGGGREALSLLMHSNLPGSGQKTPDRLVQTSWRKRYPTHQNPLQLPSRAKAIQDPQETSFNQKSLLLTLKQNESSQAKCN